ncbi:hypothetical protein MFRU_001g02860 [Monilinia fructicola]|nr:hypothetical protein MFRU_001g02860 [Monilinia fructicola]
MSFDWADNTFEAIANGELPDFPTWDFNTNFILGMTEAQISISDMMERGTCLFRCLFYKRYGTQSKGMETTAGTSNRDIDMENVEEEPEENELRLWPGGGKWRVKKRSPLRVMTLA